MRVRNFGVRAILVGLAATVLTGVAATVGAGVASACESQPTRSEAFASTLPQIHPGARGTTVQGLQLNLRYRGYPLTGTGNYGPNTLAAVQDFQRRHGIKDSGIVGAKTWHELVGTMSPVGTEAPPERPDFGVVPGDRNEEHVALVRDAIGRMYQVWREDTYYSPELQRQVKRFQRANRILPTGIVGPKTWRAMHRVISISGQWGC